MGTIISGVAMIFVGKFINRIVAPDGRYNLSAVAVLIELMGVALIGSTIYNIFS